MNRLRFEKHSIYKDVPTYASDSVHGKPLLEEKVEWVWSSDNNHKKYLNSTLYSLQSDGAEIVSVMDIPNTDQCAVVYRKKKR